MFTRTQVEKVIDELKHNNAIFVSEAHFQIAFLFEAYKLYGNKFNFIPEYPITNNSTNHDEIDLVVEDVVSKEKTFIEFKHKTKNDGKLSLTVPVYGIQCSFAPKYHGAQNLGRYDCWHDIQRIEDYKTNGKATNGFFIFLTNDDAYWKKDGSKTFGTDFSLKNNRKTQKTMNWPPNININSIGNIRNTPIVIKGNYTLKYNPYLNFNKKNGEFKILIVDM